MDNNKEYFAFISYKREDEKWAVWLQNKLEHYKLPSNMNGRTDLPKEIRPIFRDKTDLTGGFLSAKIQNALEASKYLIVICSPRAAQSQWVGKEVKSFIDMGRTDKIIPFIIGGTAHAQSPEDECFPSALLNLPPEQELLGINIDEMGRDAAAVKVVAQMFGLKFDALWQRYEREQKRKRNNTIISVFALALAAFGVAGWIWQQNDKITQQNIEIKDKGWEMMKNRARFVTTEINDLIEKGDSYTACKLALDILPIDLTNPDKPCLEELEIAFRRATSENCAMINCDWVGASTFSPDGTMIAECGSYESTIVWDANSGAKLWELGKFHNGNENSDRPKSITFSQDSKYILTEHNLGDFSLWDITTGERVCHFQTIDNIPKEILSKMSETCTVKDSWDNEWYGTPSARYCDDSTRYMLPGNPIILRNTESTNLIKSFKNTGIDYIQYCGASDTLIGKNINGCYLWNYNNGDLVFTIDNAIDVIASGDKHLALYKNGDTIEVRDYFHDQRIVLFEVEKPLWCEDYEIERAYFSPDGKCIIVELEMFIALFYDSNTGELIQSLEVQSEGEIYGVVSQNSCYYAVIGALDGFSLYDLTSFCCLKDYLGDDEGVAISDKGEKCASASYSGSISVYDCRNGLVVIMPLSENLGRTNGLAFDHSGRLLVSAHDDGCVRIWNCETGALMNELKGHKGRCITAFFAVDNRSIISIDEFGIVKVWEYLPLQELIDQARRRFKNNPLTPEERYQYYLE